MAKKKTKKKKESKIEAISKEYQTRLLKVAGDFRESVSKIKVGVEDKRKELVARLETKKQELYDKFLNDLKKLDPKRKIKKDGNSLVKK